MGVEFVLGVAREDQLPMNTSLPLYNTDSALTTAIPAPWVVKAAGKGGTIILWVGGGTVV